MGASRGLPCTRARASASVDAPWIFPGVFNQLSCRVVHWSQPGRVDLDAHEVAMLDSLGDMAKHITIVPCASSTRRVRRWYERQRQVKAASTITAPSLVSDR